MKTITKILMLCLAVALAACQAEEIIVPAEQTPQTLTFKATIGGEQTRVSYTKDDVTGNVKLAWEIGDIVKLYEGNTEKATFYLTEIDGETATFVCDDSYHVSNPKSAVGGTTLVYSPKAVEKQVQKSNGNVDHVKNFNSLSATVPTGTDLTANSQTFTFKNQSAIYKVTLTAPTDIKCGDEFTLKLPHNNKTIELTLGEKSTDEVFVAKDQTLTAYFIHHDIGDYYGTVNNDKFNFTLVADDGRYTYTATTTADKYYYPGKIYTADLTEITPTKVPMINGHEWVDVGLRLSDISSITAGSDADRRIVFATTNIGAENYYDAGYYFSWGDLRGFCSTDISDTYQLIDKDGNIEVCDGDYPAVNSAERWPIDKIEGLDFQGRTDLRGFGYTYHKDADGNAYCTPAYYGDAATHFWGKGWVMMSQEVASRIAGNYTKPSRSVDSYNTGNGLIPYMKVSGSGNSFYMPAVGYLDVANKELYSQTNAGRYWTSTPFTQSSFTSTNYYAYYLILNTAAGTASNMSSVNKNTSLKYAFSIRPIAYLPINSDTPDVDWQSNITVPAKKDEFQRFDFGKDGWYLSIVNTTEYFKVDLNAQNTEEKTITATFPKAGNVTLSFKHSIALNSGNGDGQYDLKVYIGNELKGTYSLGTTATTETISLTNVTDATQVKWMVSTKTTSSAEETHTALISGVTLTYSN